MANLSVKKRPLTKLMPDECQSIFAMAFGYAPPLEKVKLFSIAGPVTIYFDEPGHRLVLYPSGQIMALRGHSEPTCFNAWKVVKLLDSYNVAFGDH